MFIFSKCLSFNFLCVIFDLKIFTSPNLLKFGTGVHCYNYPCYDFIIYFFQNSFHSYLFRPNLVLGKNFMHIFVFMFILSKFLSDIFLAKFGLKISSFINLQKIVKGYITISLLQFPSYLTKLLSIIFFGQVWSQNLKLYKLTKIWCRGTLPYDYYNFNV